MKIILFIAFCVIWFGCEPAASPTVSSVEPVRGSIRSLFSVEGNSSSSDVLEPPFPNPYNHQLGDSTIALRFSIISKAAVKLIIQNPIGDSVAVFVDDSLEAGSHWYDWTPLNSLGEPLRAGLYFVTLRVDPDKRNYIDSRLIYIENND